MGGGGEGFRSGVMDNEMANQFAKGTASGLQHSVPDKQRWEASISHLSRVTSENRSKETAQWISEHIRPERLYQPPSGMGLPRRALRKARKPQASRYFQPLSGHVAIGVNLDH